MHPSGLCVYSSIDFHPKVPLVTLPRLVHLRVTLLLDVLRLRRSIEDSRIHDDAPANLYPAALQIAVHPLEDPSPAARDAPAEAGTGTASSRPVRAPNLGRSPLNGAGDWNRTTLLRLRQNSGQRYRDYGTELVMP